MNAYGIGLAACLATGPAIAATAGDAIYYGNVVVTGSNGCSAIGTSVVFPATLSYTTDEEGDGTFYLRTLIQSSANTLVLQHLLDIIRPDGTFNAFDPQLFGTTESSGGSYTGAITFDSSLADEMANVGTVDEPLTLTSTTGSCTLTLQGTLYFTPD
jgi:hypothetical protein